tara:strand:- start:314 stop:658 length:345 start_codon:yes stop_codon:yes gene_type:complete
MKLSSKDLLNLNIIDEIIPEPIGGAHRDKDLILDNVRNSIKKNLEFFSTMNKNEVINDRKNKFLSIGRKEGFTSQNDTKLSMKKNTLDRLVKDKKIIYITFSILILIIIIFSFL